MPAGVLIALCAYAIYSCGDAIIKGFSGHLTVFEIGFFTACFSLLPAMVTKQSDEQWRRTFKLNRPWLVHLRSASGVCSSILVTYSFTTIPLAEVYSIVFLAPVFITIISVLVLKERIHKYRIAGVALSLLGVGILVFDPAVANEMPGIALTVLASLIWSASSLIQRNLKGVPVLTIYAWIGLVGTVLLVPVVAAIEPDGMRAIPHIPLKSFGWVAFSAIGSTLIGHGSMSWLLQRHPVSSVTPLTLAAPVLSVAFASMFFRTPLTPLMILGGIVALTGVAIVTIRSARVGEGRA